MIIFVMFVLAVLVVAPLIPLFVVSARVHRERKRIIDLAMKWLPIAGPILAGAGLYLLMRRRGASGSSSPG